MEKAYFFRDIKNIYELRKRTVEAIQNGATPIPYHIRSTIELNNDDFINFIKQISKGHPIFKEIQDEMTADNIGIWNCIVVHTKKSKEKIVIYYGGFRYPRFVALAK